MKDSVIRLKPRQYVHILDNNTGVTRLEVGPQVITLKDHEMLVLEQQSMIVIPPRHFCVISNPVVRSDAGDPVRDRYGNVKLREGDREVRFEQEPFALHPGEELLDEVSPLQVVEANNALLLRATRDVSDARGKHSAGEEWLFVGPGTYYPAIEVEVVRKVLATVVKPNQALKLRARRSCKDRNGTERKAGEEWLWRLEGAYLPDVEEEIVEVVSAIVLTEKSALHLQATRTFADVFGNKRRAGDEWLVTIRDAETHIPDVYEKIVGIRQITTLSDREWCVVVDPVDAQGTVQLGKREVRKGRVSFFLHPGESLEKGVQKIYVLGEQEAILLRAQESFTQEDGTARKPGDRWMIHGPADYIPRVEIEVLEKRTMIPLDKNEGLYVRDNQTGEIRLERGPLTYMLRPYEELWEKELPQVVEELLGSDPLFDRRADSGKQHEAPPTKGAAAAAGGAGGAAAGGRKPRDRTRAVVFRVPQSAASQVYDYKRGKARVVFGPDLVMLEPDEMFTVLSLSGGKPKQAQQIKSLALLLGPDFMTDITTVDTSDHAQLRVQLSYNWHFDISGGQETGTRLFNVPDFVGDACKAIASRVRGAVASVRFEEFHKNQAKVIRRAVFGTSPDGHVGDEFRFPANNLVVTNVDIQSVEPVDEQTRTSLQRSVQIAIKITTDAQEAAARHDADRLEQEAKARIERQNLIDRRESESERKQLLELQVETRAIEATGAAAAGARAESEAARIKGEAAINLARQEAEAETVRHQSRLAWQKSESEAEITRRHSLNELEINRSRALAAVQTEEFKEKIAAIGADTLRAMAQAGPEMQAKLLGGLGLKSVLITDGRNPINLFNTAQGLIADASNGSAPSGNDTPDKT